ncbi:hypothetical protein HID58_018939, partial [Brassica napus]
SLPSAIMEIITFVTFLCLCRRRFVFDSSPLRCGCSETEKRDELMGVDIILFDDKSTLMPATVMSISEYLPAPPSQ